MGNLFERLAQGRPPVEEPAPPATPLPQACCSPGFKTAGPGRPLVREKFTALGLTARGSDLRFKMTETLVRRGFLVPTKTHRYDRKVWRIAIGP